MNFVLLFFFCFSFKIKGSFKFNMNIVKYNRILSVWIVINIILYNILNKKNFSIKIGPNDDLIIMEIIINTYLKFFLLLFYIILKTIVTNINNQIIHPWIILNIQNQNQNQILNDLQCYKIIIISNLYGWFDWFCNLILLFSQIDICLFSLTIDLMANQIVTMYYLNKKKIKDIELTNLI